MWPRWFRKLRFKKEPPKSLAERVCARFPEAIRVETVSGEPFRGKMADVLQDLPYDTPVRYHSHYELDAQDAPELKNPRIGMSNHIVTQAQFEEFTRILGQLEQKHHVVLKPQVVIHMGSGKQKPHLEIRAHAEHVMEPARKTNAERAVARAFLNFLNVRTGARWDQT